MLDSVRMEGGVSNTTSFESCPALTAWPILINIVVEWFAVIRINRWLLSSYTSQSFILNILPQIKKIHFCIHLVVLVYRKLGCGCLINKSGFKEIPHPNKHFNIIIIGIGLRFEAGKRSKIRRCFEPNIFRALPSLKRWTDSNKFCTKRYIWKSLCQFPVLFILNCYYRSSHIKIYKIKGFVAIILHR